MDNKSLLRAGDKISGNYVVREKISAGSSGQVYTVDNLATGEVQALKIIPKTNEDTEREIDILAKLNLYKNIVRISDFGFTKINGMTATYVVMDFYSKGEITNLTSDADYQIMSNKELFYYMKQALEGLRSLHYGSTKIIHKDIKPANILVDGAKDIFLSDFGISIFGREINDQHGVKGTAKFMAPESKYEMNTNDKLALGYSADIFALGIIFYKLATGVYPLEDYEVTIKDPNNATPAERNKSLLFLNVWETIPEPIKYNPDIDPAINLIISKMITKDWNKRYQSVVDIEKDLNNYIIKGKLPKINVDINEIPVNAPFKKDERKQYVYKYDKFSRTFDWRFILYLVIAIIVISAVFVAVIFEA